MRKVLVVGLLSAAVAALAGCGSSGDDARAQALALAKDDIACTVTTDCCGVVDGCLASILLVSAADQAEAQELLANASQDVCVACITPPVQVDCREGRCVAVEIESDGTGTGVDWPVGFSEDHCGALEIPAGWQEKAASSGQRFGLRPATVIGCGD
jgi:hypothetical protein